MQLKRLSVILIMLKVAAVCCAPVLAGTFEAASRIFYKLNGQDEPVFGYKLAVGNGPNFIACDGTRYTASPSDLVPTSGQCGDSKTGVTLYSVKLDSDGLGTVHIFDSTLPDVQPLVGADVKISFGAIKANGLLQKPLVANSAVTLVTNNNVSFLNGGKF